MKQRKMKQLFQKNKQILLYLFFGVCTTGINTVCYGILYEHWKVSNMVSTVLAWLAAVIFAFFTNRSYVFESGKTGRAEKIREFISFFGCRILTGVLDVMIMAFAVDYMHWNSLIWKLCSNILVIILNFVASKFVIFTTVHKKK